ncbi:D-amino-acid oxidase [Lentinula raphanica]|nr:D-amino-acid oxidase [Lentinula raphanica]
MTSAIIGLPSEREFKHILVLGAGVVGLTTAISILESSLKYNYIVTILATHLPTDPKSISYTSHWAGAHHVSHATGTDANSSTSAVEHPDQLAIDQETFRTMWELSAQGNEAEKCFMRIEQVEYYHEEIPVDKDGGEVNHHLRWYPDVSPTSRDVRSGVSFTTLTIDTPVYLQYLYERFVDRGGRVLKGRVDDIQDLEGVQRALREARPITPNSTEFLAQIEALINCTGLGSLTLRGVIDNAVYPLRGQTVLLRVPWIKFGRTISSKGKEGQDDLWTYIIPRRSGNVIIGGIKTPNDTHPTPRPETTLDILRRGVRLCPELLQPPKSSDNIDSDFLNLIEPLIVEVGCGLRPARKGGVRLEIDRIGSTGLPIIHNYGHSGSGFQSSWGSATRAWKLLEEVL